MFTVFYENVESTQWLKKSNFAPQPTWMDLKYSVVFLRSIFIFRDTYDNFYRWNCISVLPCRNSEEWEDLGTGFNEVHEAVTGHCRSWDMDTWGFIACIHLRAKQYEKKASWRMIYSKL